MCICVASPLLLVSNCTASPTQTDCRFSSIIFDLFHLCFFCCYHLLSFASAYCNANCAALSLLHRGQQQGLCYLRRRIFRTSFALPKRLSAHFASPYLIEPPLRATVGTCCTITCSCADMIGLRKLHCAVALRTGIARTLTALLQISQLHRRRFLF